MKTGILILAAGSASRMKQPKMLLPFGEGTILSHLLQETRKVKDAAICLVTGYYHTEIMAAVSTEGIQVVQNKQWQQGMAGSIQLGLSSLLQQQPELETVMILVSDQPYLTQNLLTQMLQLQSATGKSIVAAVYGSTKGTPVLFTRNYFNRLQELTGDKGAKSILQSFPQDLVTVDFPEGIMDIDTPEDYEKFCVQIK